MLKTLIAYACTGIGRLQGYYSLIPMKGSWILARLRSPVWLVASAYLFAIGSVYWLLYSLSYRAAAKIFPTILPHYRIEAPMFKEQLLFFGYFVIVLTGSAAIPWILRCFPVASRILDRVCAIAGTVPILFYAVVYALAIWRAPSAVARVILSAAFATLAIHGMARLMDGGDPEKGKRISGGSGAEKLLAVFFILSLVYAGAQFVVSWYPVALPDEYYELSDRFIILREGDQTKSLDRGTVLNFLSWTNYDTCRAGGVGRCIEPYLEGPRNDVCRASAPTMCAAPSQPRPNALQSDFDPQFWAAIKDAIHDTGFWQPLTGRIFQHHASAFVPAKHLLTYGLGAPIPFLYGFGYTSVFTAAFSIFSPSLTTYFNAYPATILFGVAVIALAVGYGARSSWAALAAFSTAAAFIYYIGYDSMQLSAGFNPMRFVGISIQIASVFFLFRSSSAYAGTISLLAAFLFSLFWNVEFGVFGAIGQMLALFSPLLNISRRHRLVAAGVFLLGIAGVVIERQIPLNLIRANDLIYFGVIMPYELTQKDFVVFLAFCMISAIAACLALRGFEPNERHVRLSIMPIFAIMLIKYVYMTQTLHLAATMIFVGPFLLVYAKWPPFFAGRAWRASVGRSAAVAYCAAATIFGIIAATGFRVEAQTIKSHMIEPFEPDYGAALHENIRFSMPIKPLADRADAIRAVMKADDAVLMLSPFDHLLAFYVNAQRYCGHFEPLNNVATTSDVRLIADCLQESPHALVIYDDALKTPCPQDPSGRYVFYFESVCSAKIKFKRDLDIVFDSLRDNLDRVGRAGELTFYRVKKATGADH